MNATVVALFLIALTGCAPNFATRLPIYEQCAKDAGLGVGKAIMLANSLEGQGAPQAVEDGLARILGSNVPVEAALSCGKAIETAKAAIKAGKAAK